MQVSVSWEHLFLSSSSFWQQPAILSLRVCLSYEDMGCRGPATSLCPPGAMVARVRGVPVLDGLLPCRGPACGLLHGGRGGLCPAAWWAGRPPGP